MFSQKVKGLFYAALVVLVSLALVSGCDQIGSFDRQEEEAAPGEIMIEEPSPGADDAAPERGSKTTPGAGQKSKIDEDGEDNLRGNSMGNLACGGFAAMQGDWVYYFAGQSDDGKRDAFYKMLSDGSGRTLVAEIESEDDLQVFASSINVVGPWLYYNNINIMKVDMETGESEPLAYEWAEGLTVIEDWVYYISVNYDGAIVKVKTDGSSHTILTEDATQHMVVTDDWIYYENASLIYRIDHNGENKAKVGSDHTRRFTIDEGWIYYISRDDNDRVYRVSLEGDQRSRVSESGAYLVNAYEGWVYFTSSSDDAKLYKVPGSGGEEIKLSLFATNGISILDNWIYLYDVDDYEAGLYKMDLDGGGLQKVHQ